MNTQKRIEQCLRAAPKPPAPDGLLDKLQEDVSAHDIKAHRSSLGRWFAPTGGSISLWRAAAAAAIAVVVLLPLSYGAVKGAKKVISGFNIKKEYKLSGSPELKEIMNEVRQLRKAGDFDRTLVEEWQEDDGTTISVHKDVFTLSDGRTFTMTRREEVRKTEKGEAKRIKMISSGFGESSSQNE